MGKVLHKKREEARRLFLTGEAASNAEIAARLKTKPHTISRWRAAECWDDMKLKIDRRASELLVEKLATDKVSLNVRHFKLWEFLLGKLASGLKDQGFVDFREIERVAAVLDKAQKGQRLAKGLSEGGTEEAARAQSQAQTQRLIDVFIEAVKENVADENTRDKIRRAILDGLPPESSD